MSSLRNSYSRITDSELGIVLRAMTDDGVLGTNANAAVNGSITPVDFWVQPPPTTEFVLNRLAIEVSDGGNPGLDDYGAITGPLPNGIQFFIERDTVKEDFGGPITSNREIVSIFPEVEILPFAGSIQLRLYSFDVFTHSNSPVVLQGNTNDKFGVTIQDNLLTLANHSFSVKGNVRAVNV